MTYWDDQWIQRDNGPYTISGNRGKRKIIIDQLWKRRDYIDRSKLEIGCGLCHHAALMGRLNPEWVKKYEGVEPSVEAERRVKEYYGFKVHPVCVEDLVTDKKYGLFLFLDSLEHVENLEKTASKIAELSEPHAIMFGNIPLYHSQHPEQGGFERLMDINVMVNFAKDCGFEKLWHHVYGVNGYPYMLWEAR